MGVVQKLHELNLNQQVGIFKGLRQLNNFAFCNFTCVFELPCAEVYTVFTEGEFLCTHLKSEFTPCTCDCDFVTSQLLFEDICGLICNLHNCDEEPPVQIH